MKRLFVFDLDGTLLSSKGKILPSSKEAIEKVKQNGDHLLISTGRPIESTVHVAKEAGIKDIYSCNGGVYFDTETSTQLFKEFMSIESVLKVIDIFGKDETYKIIVMHDAKLTIFNHENTWASKELLGKYLEGNTNEFVLGELDQFIEAVKSNGPVYKIVVDAYKKENVEAVVEELETFDKSEYTWYLDPYRFGEIGPAKVNKWSGIEKYVKHFDIDVNQVYTFGDGHNDIEMITNASHGIAMGNAVNSIKNASRFVTDSNNDNGIARVIYMVYSNTPFEL